MGRGTENPKQAPHSLWSLTQDSISQPELKSRVGTLNRLGYPGAPFSRIFFFNLFIFPNERDTVYTFEIMEQLVS